MPRTMGSGAVSDEEIRAGILAEFGRRALLGLPMPSTTDLRDCVRGSRNRVCRIYKEMYECGEIARPMRKRITNRVKGAISRSSRAKESEWRQMVREHFARERRIRSFVLRVTEESKDSQVVLSMVG